MESEASKYCLSNQKEMTVGPAVHNSQELAV